MKKQLFRFAVFCLTLAFLSCKTIPRFKGQGDLCGLVVDENNEPVKDFLIYCKNEFEVTSTALTNETGMFVIHGVPSGIYKISGKKKDYAKLAWGEFYFTDRDRIFCCQVESIEGAFKTAEQFMLRGEIKNAESVIDSLCYDKKTPQQAVVLVYKFFLSEKNREKKRIINEIRKIGRIEDVDYSEYADSLEELLNEKKI